MLEAAPSGRTLERFECCFRTVSRIAKEAAFGSLASAAGHAARLATLARDTLDNEELATSTESQELIATLHAALAHIEAVLSEQPDSVEALQAFQQQTLERWGEWLELLDIRSVDDESFVPFSSLPSPASDDSASQVDDEPEMPSADELDALITAVRTLPIDSGAASNDAADSPDLQQATPIPSNLIDDDEMLEAYLDDARRGVTAMEEALLHFEAHPDDRRPLEQLARELHTLKGASASVGLAELADFLHKVEDDLRCCNTQGAEAPDIPSVLASVDAIQLQIETLTRSAQGDRSTEADCGAVGRHSYSEPVDPEGSLRVRATQVDRLMDMLAELVMLRNQRDAHVDQLNDIQRDLLGCVTRLRAQDIRADRREAVIGDESRLELGPAEEVIDDVLDNARRLRDFCEPIAEENLTISRFIRQFRQELVELRRVPVAGLFRRLQRAVQPWIVSAVPSK